MNPLLTNSIKYINIDISSNNSNEDSSKIKTKTRDISIKKEKQKRVVTTTTKWCTDQSIEDQLKYIQQIHHSLDSCLDPDPDNQPSLIYKLIVQQINQKICGYRSQDIHKKLLSESEFVDIKKVVYLMIECKNLCFYCKQSVQVLYDHVREPMQWTLERINNSFGHNKTNVVIACLNCNLHRKTMHHERYVFTKQLKIVKNDN